MVIIKQTKVRVEELYIIDFELFKNSFHSKEYINNTSIRSPEQQHSSQLDLKHLQHRCKNLAIINILDNKENAFSPEGILKAFTNQPNFGKFLSEY